MADLGGGGGVVADLGGGGGAVADLGGGGGPLPDGSLNIHECILRTASAAVSYSADTCTDMGGGGGGGGGAPRARAPPSGRLIKYS